MTRQKPISCDWLCHFAKNYVWKLVIEKVGIWNPTGVSGEQERGHSAYSTPWFLSEAGSPRELFPVKPLHLAAILVHNDFIFEAQHVYSLPGWLQVTALRYRKLTVILSRWKCIAAQLHSCLFFPPSYSPPSSWGFGHRFPKSKDSPV